MVSERRRRFMKLRRRVLILIMLEYGLGAVCLLKFANTCRSLNPYYAGIWSRSKSVENRTGTEYHRLNPYYAGIWSRSTDEQLFAAADNGS